MAHRLDAGMLVLPASVSYSRVEPEWPWQLHANKQSETPAVSERKDGERVRMGGEERTRDELAPQHPRDESLELKRRFEDGEGMFSFCRQEMMNS